MYMYVMNFPQLLNGKAVKQKKSIDHASILYNLGSLIV